MDIDPSEFTIDAEERKSRLNTLVAITVALLATFTGICKVKDDNIVQAMQQAQADSIDHWAWYQSLHVREEIVSGTIDTLTAEQAANPSSAAYKAALTAATAKLNHLTEHKTEVQKQAQDDKNKYDSLNYRDDQFDLSDVMMALAISLLAVTALVQKPWLYALAMIPAFFGILMGLAGLIGWHIHPDALMMLLS